MGETDMRERYQRREQKHGRGFSDITVSKGQLSGKI